LVKLIGLGLSVIFFELLVDRLFFSAWTFPPYNFLEFNLFHNLGIFYGSHPFHWYFTQGIPFVLWTFLPFVFLGMKITRYHPILFIIIWTTLIYSVLGHKEFRFIFPILPLFFCYCGNYLYSLVPVIPFRGFRLFGTSQPHLRPKVQKKKEGIKQVVVVVLLILSQTLFAIYFNTIHQRGVIDVSYYLKERSLKGELKSVLFLMPCHSTPWQSYFHSNATNFHFITCHPPLEGQDINTYKDESDLFYENPVPSTKQYLQKLKPSHIVMFEALYFLPEISLIMEQNRYEKVASFFNSHLIDDSRKAGDVLVFERK